jgi:hypothetical protein
MVHDAARSGRESPQRERDVGKREPRHRRTRPATHCPATADFTGMREPQHDAGGGRAQVLEQFGFLGAALAR